MFRSTMPSPCPSVGEAGYLPTIVNAQLWPFTVWYFVVSVLLVPLEYAMMHRAAWAMPVPVFQPTATYLPPAPSFRSLSILLDMPVALFARLVETEL